MGDTLKISHLNELDYPQQRHDEKTLVKFLRENTGWVAVVTALAPQKQTNKQKS